MNYINIDGLIENSCINMIAVSVIYGLIKLAVSSLNICKTLKVPISIITIHVDFHAKKMIVPNPRHKISSNSWDLNILSILREPTFALFIRYCVIMERIRVVLFKKD